MAYKTVDYLNGYETGLKKGKKRIGRGLYDRHAPEHLSGIRLDDWNEGYQIGLIDRAQKRTSASWYNKDGKEERKTWNYHLSSKQRGDFIDMVRASVLFVYTDHRDDYCRTVNGGY